MCVKEEERQMTVTVEGDGQMLVNGRGDLVREAGGFTGELAWPLNAEQAREKIDSDKCKPQIRILEVANYTRGYWTWSNAPSIGFLIIAN